MNFNEMILPVSKKSIFREEGYLVWCGSVVKGEKGNYYLFYSRWPCLNPRTELTGIRRSILMLFEPKFYGEMGNIRN